VKGEISRLEDKIEAAEERAAEAETERRDAFVQIDRKEETIEELESEIREAKVEKASVKSEIATKRSELADVEAEIEGADTEFDELKAELAGEGGRIESLRGEKRAPAREGPPARRGPSALERGERGADRLGGRPRVDPGAQSADLRAAQRARQGHEERGDDRGRGR